MKKLAPRIFLIPLAAAIAATLFGCGGGGGAPPPPVASTAGTLGVAITDAAYCGFDAVNVTVNKVRVHQSATASDTDAGWTDITLNPARKINLLSLTNGVLDALGTTPLEPGHYTQLRLVLDANTGNGTANTVVPAGTVGEQTLDTPSAVQSGIKLNHAFDVAAGQRVDLVLDFDVCKSVLTKGNGKFALRPVIKVVPTEVNGITGFVSTAAIGSKIVVSAQQNGVIVNATVPDVVTGKFFLARLPVGDYNVVATSDASAASVISSVPIDSATRITTVSTAAAPIALLPSITGNISGTVSLSPPSATEAAFVSANQTLVAGPTVAIKYQGADLATGDYSIANLPIANPQFAIYTPLLPLVFKTQPTTLLGLGRYRLEASAAGYATKAVPLVDISTVNQANVNFNLVP